MSVRGSWHLSLPILAGALPSVHQGAVGEIPSHLLPGASSSLLYSSLKPSLKTTFLFLTSTVTTCNPTEQNMDLSLAAHSRVLQCVQSPARPPEKLHSAVHGPLSCSSSLAWQLLFIL